MAAGPGPWLLAWALALWPAGLRAQWRLQEAGGGLRVAGSSVTLSCHGSGYPFRSYGIWWYRQALGGSLEWVSFIAVTGQMTLEQHSREEIMGEGNEVTFECSMRGDYMGNYVMSWYRQDPRGALECIWRGHYTCKEGFQDHFRGLLVESNNKFTLEILAAKQGDSATYYCGAESPWSSSAAESTKNQQMGMTDLSAFLSSSCSLGLLSGNGRCRKHPSGLVTLKALEGGVVEGLVPCMVQEDLFWELQRLFGEVQL